jgi:hypothetical protein
MKYLTKYRLFENSNYDNIKSNIVEIAQTVKEILLPISDMGYEISVIDDVLKGKLTGLIIKVVDFKDTPLKVTDEVKDEFIRMNDYLESEGFNSIKAIYVGSQANIRGRVDFSKFISINSGNAFSKRFMSLVFVAEVD